ncbi:Glucosylceramidase [Aphelenchoides besseyi]|nr:Glucosylceramidase [Aphelenchoides besseyi]KAI6199407.1 Glucosylceramidase [Aphelenchoides besseyi]
MFRDLRLILLLFVACPQIHGLNECKKRYYDQDSFVCVCDTNGCDEIEPIGDFNNDEVVVYTTSRASDRLKKTMSMFSAKLDRDIRATVDTKKRYQQILGFGGATTDAVVVVRNQLMAANASMAELLHQQYYGPKGLGYSISRVPLGSCDFSESEYSFAEIPDDFAMEHFELNDIKAEYLKKIVKEVPDMKLMKNTGRMKGPGKLIGPFNRFYYLAYARYIIKFFEEYFLKHGIKFFAMTVQNEPETGDYGTYPFQTMYLSAQMQRDFVNLRLGPMMKNNWITKDIKILGCDDQRNATLNYAMTIYNVNRDKSAVPGDYIDGIAVHWYVLQAPYYILTDVHLLRPEKMILATEACNSFANYEQIPYNGRWKSAELYCHDIIQNLRNWVVGWTDWNIHLNTMGGPNWVGNYVDAPILVNVSAEISDLQRSDGNRNSSAKPPIYHTEFFKQTSFYALAHFSKFIPRNSTIVDLTIDGFGGENDDLEGVVVVLHNRHDKETYTLEVDDLLHDNEVVKVKIGPKSIKTLIWKAKN